ncbi:response regulator [Candidatus Margulisiibacteriota bacterium]
MTEEIKARILVADDEPSILMLISVMLKDAGYEVITAENGQQAIEKAQEEKPDMIITDIIMPEKNGFEVCQTVRSLPAVSDTPIIILSALGDEYNKITGFDDGADDYVTKPFNMEELKARVQALLIRNRGRKIQPSTDPAEAEEECTTAAPDAAAAVGKSQSIVDQVPSGSAEIDRVLNGGFPKGGNVLLVGSIGSGKSSFCRNFISTGLKKEEKCMFISLDDDPSMIRKMFSMNLNQDITSFEENDKLCFVDAYSWSAGAGAGSTERFSISGVLELNQLSGVIADASADLGQTIQQKAGGRRIVDSISSLLVNFELPSVQRFLSQIARTAVSFGGVTSLFLLEEGTVSEQVLNNIKYLMDGVIELKEENGQSVARVANMKWICYSKEWVTW